MAEDTEEKLDSNDDVQDAAPINDESTQSKSPGSLKRLFNSKIVIVLVVLTLVINGVGLAFHSIGRGSGGESGGEHDLGDFHFIASLSEKGQIAAADFRLHIALLEDVESEAHHRLTNRKFRVQQDIEELLRQAHSGDFADPTLGELKRRIQARINETLGLRAIADVIITDLKLTSGNSETKPPAETSESMPWVDNSST